jgi:hypothetical protein
VDALAALSRDDFETWWHVQYRFWFWFRRRGGFVG